MKKGKSDSSSRKNCKKGYSCGLSCIQNTKNCRNPLDGQGRNYAEWIEKSSRAKVSNGFPDDEKAGWEKPLGSIQELHAQASDWAKHHGLDPIDINDPSFSIDKGHDIQHLLMHRAIGMASEEIAKEAGDESSPNLYEEALVEAFVVVARGDQNYGELVDTPRWLIERVVENTLRDGVALYPSQNPIYQDIPSLVATISDRAEAMRSSPGWSEVEAKSREVDNFFR